jgi:hypothetical protein
MPAAETLPVRQRTILEERALLGGLGGRAAPLPTSPKKATGGRRSVEGTGSDRGSSGRKPSPAKLPAAGKKEAR